MTKTQRKKLVNEYLGKTVTVVMDRPLGYVHKKANRTLKYPINYGYIPGVLGGDGEELDVYLLGVDEPVAEYTAKIIGACHRENDVEDKLVAAPEGTRFNQADIAKAVHFQEKYYKTSYQSIYEKSCGTIIYRINNGVIEYLCVKQRHSGYYSVPKGHTEPFESERKTAVREAFEEVGLTPKLHRGFRQVIEYKLGHGRRKTVALFLAPSDKEGTPDKNEISECKWFALNEAIKCLPKWYKPALIKAENYINKFVVNNKKPTV